ncbi:uncharacterized protein MYCFIDRAFT_174197 [Pseudocercospora fijiensis CIRAD86]|uniref:Uncharacterized protein n=1 Tax=Pseudocercospora fijiensis (strain CIRAD86) TaxID=383855 RepID=M3AZJ9_PSEFD|nr:uncharacterized protein MYCFIDRAFT_174197 [Pseudocercospora fijiensis CIRAD86]EME82627.1 hypothetical protein MYCFIDRAFT_174197 [Pseudocercospora fijiensis CIRAD86]
MDGTRKGNKQRTAKISYYLRATVQGEGRGPVRNCFWDGWMEEMNDLMIVSTRMWLSS